MGILAWLGVGLVAGLLAKFLMPGDDPGGLIGTILIGVVGGVIGGFLGNFMGLGSVDGFNFGSIGLAILGALVLLVAIRMLRRG